MKVLVAGTGPCAAAVVDALIKRGVCPIVLDAGLRLEPDVAEFASRLAGLSPSDWPDNERDALFGSLDATSRGIPLKLLFGSNFPYLAPDAAPAITIQGAGIKPSYAYGGLSNVWGAAILAHRPTELTDWPSDCIPRPEDYTAVAALAGMSGAKDGLDEEFPFCVEEATPLRLSAQGQSLKKHLERHRDKLRKKKVIFGAARLALSAQPSCRYCGMCMEGCVYDVIFNSARCFETWARERKIELKSGWVITKFSEYDKTVTVEGRRGDSGEPFQLSANALFIACGLLPTTQLAMSSLGLYGREAKAIDSQYFLVPFLRFQGEKGVRSEALHTLSQIFIELLSVPGLKYGVHLQVYGYNDLIGQIVHEKLGLAGRMIPALEDALAGRLLVLQGYLHSKESDQLTLRLDREGKLTVSPHGSREVKGHIAKVMRRLITLAPQLGGIPLVPMLSIGETGRGFHSGGSFPMSSMGGEFATDALGRLGGFHHVHLADAAVLPTIPATTVTFASMANARRIASLAPLG